MFDSTGTVLASTAQFSAAEITAYTTAFNDRDATVGAGLTVGGVNYEVHRYVVCYFGFNTIWTDHASDFMMNRD